MPPRPRSSWASRPIASSRTPAAVDRCSRPGTSRQAHSAAQPSRMDQPTPGALPTMKVGRSDRRHKDTHAAVLQLSRRLQATLQAHYCRRLAIAEQALQLECSSSTVHARVRDAKRLLGLALSDRR